MTLEISASFRHPTKVQDQGLIFLDWKTVSWKSVADLEKVICAGEKRKGGNAGPSQ